MKTAVVSFLTYTPSMEHPRTEYARLCLKALLKNLSFNEGDLRYHIADDGSPEEHVQSLISLVQAEGKEPTVSISDRAGYGGNFNRATQETHAIADFVLPIEEDWELVRKLDLSDVVRAMESDNRIKCVRLGYLGWTNPVLGELIQSAAQTFLLFDPSSPETHIFAGHPRIETVEFEKRVGAWPEGLRAGFTEMEICNRPIAREGVCWPLDMGVNASQDYVSLFAHVGERRSDE